MIAVARREQTLQIDNRLKTVEQQLGGLQLALDEQQPIMASDSFDIDSHVRDTLSQQEIAIDAPAPAPAWHINLGNFDSREVALGLQQRLQAIGHQTRIKPVTSDDKLREVLQKEIEEGKIEIEASGQMITVRVREKGTFPSASATLHPDFLPVMDSLSDALGDIEGSISVEGHTDNILIASASFVSNWDLSASRALTVAHELIKGEKLDATRFVVVGHADTRPFTPNTSAENRSYNRRVEIIIRQGLASSTDLNVDQLQNFDSNDE